MKSIFGKYLMTFTVILLCCIIVILFAVSTNIADESYAVQRDIINSSAGSTSIVLESYLSDTGYEGIYSAFSENSDMQELIDYFASSSRADVYVFEKNGLLVGSTDDQIPAGLAYLSDAALNVMLSHKDSYAISTVEGFFRANRFNSYLVTYVEGEPFIVMVSIRNYIGIIFTRDIIIVAITVALWVFLAAMISLYVISRRTTQPLSEIISAAKDYSKGRFDRKIEVVGYDEVAELAKAINDMASSLAKIDSERNSFIGNVSHDLRTPMTTISGFVDGILDGTIPPEKHEYYLNIISQEVKRLSRLVNSLLEASRIESGGELKRTDFNLSETARTVLISLESKISGKNIDIEFDSGEEDIFVNADSDSIHRVIFNLMDNAVKFTPEKGIISIGITTVADGRKKRKALFSIRNSGEGIPKEELPHLFERFYKTDRSRGLDKSGTGLGLYIAKTSIVNHGEDLVVDSVSGEYTEFKFTLPVCDNLPRRNASN
ncbi:MAG: HAMP domain-containing histidine kinase [Clostridia bacterium]|nr:HAMP domain-containing histidine kinase [Clostridia bacterium]MBQ9848192.1 HAMP domain-containing histidine kinase [Clostridia bacterium]